MVNDKVDLVGNGLTADPKKSSRECVGVKK